MTDNNLTTNREDEYTHLLHNIGNVLNNGKKKAVSQINQTLVKTNWYIGRYIVEYEQAGMSRRNTDQRR